jgi:hypothetical protein
MTSFFECIIPETTQSKKLTFKQATKQIGRRPTRRGKRKKVKTSKYKKEFNESLFEHKQAKKIPSMSYRMYIGSAYWKKRKNEYFKKFGKKCAVCGEVDGVTLHHKKYDNKLNGKEPDDFFVALCKYHHYEFHQNHELKQNMTKATDTYVFTMKQLKNSNIDDLTWIS